MRRVGFVINFEKNSWLGGYNYFFNLFHFFKNFENKKITPIILTDDYRKVEEIKNSFNFEIIKSDLFSNSNSFIRILNKILIFFFGKNYILENFFKKNNIEILSHSGFLGRNSSIKSYPWFLDFQEIYLPENFSLKSLILRRINVFLASIHSTQIIISSLQVQKDLKKLSKKGYDKSIIIKHCAYLPEKNRLLNFQSLKKKYNLNDAFFFLPNHYWKHKNHILVLEALKIIRDKINFQIVSSGNLNDHRNKSYFLRIKEFIKVNNLSEIYNILGIIPFDDVISLNYHSLGLINPSKSEGWSNTVEQAKAMNQKVFLSDTPVHREQKSHNFYYFDKNDPKDLANLLLANNQKDLDLDYDKSYEKIKDEQNKFIDSYQNFIIQN